MRQKFVIGAELDLISPADLQAAADRVMRKVIGLRQPPTILQVSHPVVTDGGGNIGVGGDELLLRCPQGMRLWVTRLTLEAPSATPAAPIVAGWVTVRREIAGGPLVFFFPQSGNQVAPSTWSNSQSSAATLKSGQRLLMFGGGLAANLEFIAHVQYVLVEDPAKLKGQDDQQ